jgi:hypothetical protein
MKLYADDPNVSGLVYNGLKTHPLLLRRSQSLAAGRGVRVSRTLTDFCNRLDALLSSLRLFSLSSHAARQTAHVILVAD